MTTVDYPSPSKPLGEYVYWSPEPGGMKPHRCPICYGAGKFSVTGIWLDKQTNIGELPLPDCHGCGGKGIVWG